MTIAMAEVVRIDTLDNIVFVYENAEKLYDNKSIDEDVREFIYTTFDILDNYPKGLPLMEDVIEDYENGINYEDGDSVVCLARVGDLWSSPYYNRIRELRYGNQQKHLKDNGGFSYAAADTLSGYYRPNQRKVVTTKGNNRVSKLYSIVRDPDIRIPIGFTFHPRNRSIEECVRIESNNHNMDCNYRTNQSGDHKFTSALRARETWAIILFNYLKQFNIGIAGTLPNAKFHCPSHSYISRARGKKEQNDVYVTRFLEAFTSRDCSREIQGNTVISGAQFLKYFEPYIKDVDKRNNCDSFADAIDWAFNKWSKEAQALGFKNAKNITQEAITAGNSDYKKHEPMVARWVNLYNVYCNKGLTISARQNTAIPLESDKDTKSRWNKFLIESNALVRGSLVDTAKQGLKFM
tara:strand:+ start:187 stop:1407 length:1221 start_codon:yes stop_codon:yes gene_type:complete